MPSPRRPKRKTRIALRGGAGRAPCGQDAPATLREGVEQEGAGQRCPVEAADEGLHRPRAAAIPSVNAHTRSAAAITASAVTSRMQG